MVLLEDVVKTGLFSVGSDNTFQEQMPSLGDMLLAEEFAEEINSGRLSVRDAYVNFWSYVEDKELWGLEDLADDDCRALLLDWVPSFHHISTFLDEEKKEEVVEFFLNQYKRISNAAYNINNDCLYAASIFFGQIKNPGKEISTDIFKMLTIMAQSAYIEETELAAKSLGNIYHPDAENLLISLLDRNQEKVQSRAIESLTKIATQNSVIQLVRSYLYELGNEEKIIETLKRDGLRGYAEEEFKKYMDADDDLVRYLSIKGLGIVGGTESEDSLLDLVDSNDLTLQYSAIQALGDRGCKRAVKPILEKLKSEITLLSTDLPYNAGCALVQLDEEVLIKFCQEHLDTESDVERMNVIQMLGRMKTPVAIGELIRALRMPDWGTAQHALDALDDIFIHHGQFLDNISQTPEYLECVEAVEEVICESIHDGYREITAKAQLILTRMGVEPDIELASTLIGDKPLYRETAMMSIANSRRKNVDIKGINLILKKHREVYAYGISTAIYAARKLRQPNSIPYLVSIALYNENHYDSALRALSHFDRNEVRSEIYRRLRGIKGYRKHWDGISRCLAEFGEEQDTKLLATYLLLQPSIDVCNALGAIGTRGNLPSLLFILNNMEKGYSEDLDDEQKEVYATKVNVVYNAIDSIFRRHRQKGLVAPYREAA